MLANNYGTPLVDPSVSAQFKFSYAKNEASSLTITKKTFKMWTRTVLSYWIYRPAEKNNLWKRSMNYPTLLSGVLTLKSSSDNGDINVNCFSGNNCSKNIHSSMELGRALKLCTILEQWPIVIFFQAATLLISKLYQSATMLLSHQNKWLGKFSK